MSLDARGSSLAGQRYDRNDFLGGGVEARMTRRVPVGDRITTGFFFFMNDGVRKSAVFPKKSEVAVVILDRVEGFFAAGGVTSPVNRNVGLGFGFEKGFRFGNLNPSAITIVAATATRTIDAGQASQAKSHCTTSL